MKLTQICMAKFPSRDVSQLLLLDNFLVLLFLDHLNLKLNDITFYVFYAFLKVHAVKKYIVKSNIFNWFRWQLTVKQHSFSVKILYFIHLSLNRRSELFLLRTLQTTILHKQFSFRVIKNIQFYTLWFCVEVSCTIRFMRFLQHFKFFYANHRIF